MAAVPEEGLQPGTWPCRGSLHGCYMVPLELQQAVALNTVQWSKGQGGVAAARFPHCPASLTHVFSAAACLLAGDHRQWDGAGELSTAGCCTPVIQMSCLLHTGRPPCPHDAMLLHLLHLHGISAGFTGGTGRYTGTATHELQSSECSRRNGSTAAPGCMHTEVAAQPT